MANFEQDFIQNFNQRLNIGTGVNTGLNTYIQLTNVFLGDTTIGNWVRLARTAEGALVPFFDGSKPVDEASIVFSASQLAAGALFIFLGGCVYRKPYPS
jgi:hypothetical protein